MSDKDIKVKIQLFGIGTLEAKIIRYLAPISADAIIDKFPLVLRGRFSFGSKRYWVLPGVEIYKGKNAHNAKKEVNKGDIIYNPKTDELMFILEDQILPNKANKIGEVTKNLDLILKARNGLNTKISRLKR